jgi:hypothetical protein
VWVERIAVLIANVAVNLGIASASDESAVAAGGVIGLITFVQIVLACVSHWRTIDTKLRADIAGILTDLLGNVPPNGHPAKITVTDSDSPFSKAELAARAAGKAVAP